MMATIERAAEVRPRTVVNEYPAGGFRFDLMASLLGMWFVVGLFIDGWAHRQGQVDNTFFTPWHALLYSGIAASGLFLAVNQMRNVMKGHAWLKALPRGYLLSLVGVILFFVGGGFDFLWHDMVGFEADNEALLSPAHLILAGAGALIVTGPLRAAWGRSKSETGAGWRGLFPVILSLTMMLSAVTFFVQFSNLFTNTWALSGNRTPNEPYLNDVVGISGALIPFTIMTGFLLFMIRRWGSQLPFGTVTFVVTVNALLMHWLSVDLNLDLQPRSLVVLAALIAGLIGDIILRVYKPTEVNVWALRLFAFVVPFMLTLLYFVILNATGGMWWAIHMSLGVPIICGIGCLMFSLLAFPPTYPKE